MSVRRALRMGHRIAAAYAPTEITVYRMAYASAENPFTTGVQHTYTTHVVRGTFAPINRTHEPVQAETTYSGVATINTHTLGFVPSQADRVAVGGVVYNIVEAADIQGAVCKLLLAGPSPSPVVTGDVTAPGITTAPTLTGGETTITVSGGLATEVVEHRYRWRSPAFTGTYTTGAFTGTFVTAIAGTITSLDAGIYAVQVQIRDAAGNTRNWYDLGTATVTGVPSS